MEKKHSKTIMHIDVNSAFLSFQAAYNKQIGIEKDIRDVPSVVGGSEKSRRGIVLAKSILAKKAGVKTGESIMEARSKCKDLLVVPANYELYVKSSKALINLLREYSPYIQIFSIDECFLDYTGMEDIFGDPLEAAHKMKKRISDELGFTVNIGISSNKLLAKMAGELEKPDKVNTIYPEEVEKKLWPLPVGELFMVGQRTKPKLNKIGIYTIGDLAKSDYNLLSRTLKSHGRLIHQYAWGRDESKVHHTNHIPFKSAGNGSTIKFDVEDEETAYKIILSLVETTAKRLRNANVQCSVVSIGIKDKEFKYKGHQRKLLTPTNITNEIFNISKELFIEMWDGTPIRQFNVRLSELSSIDINQLTFFDIENKDKLQKIDTAIDKIRERYGNTSIMRATFLHSGLKSMLGGFGADEYPVMTSII